MSTIDTITGDVRKIAAIIEPAFAVLAVVEAATGVGGPTADVAIKVIAAALHAFATAADGAVTHQQAMDSLASLKAQLTSNDAAADAALAARFPAGTP